MAPQIATRRHIAKHSVRGIVSSLAGMGSCAPKGTCANEDVLCSCSLSPGLHRHRSHPTYHRSLHAFMKEEEIEMVGWIC